jgi:hypothetical protein
LGAMRLLLTTSQAARRLDRTSQTVLNMVKAERLLPEARIEGKTGTFLFSPEAVEALVGT